MIRKISVLQAGRNIALLCPMGFENDRCPPALKMPAVKLLYQSGQIVGDQVYDI